jgi:hypothetical protein
MGVAVARWSHVRLAWALVVLFAQHYDKVPPRVLDHALSRYGCALISEDQRSIELVREEALLLATNSGIVFSYHGGASERL